MKKQYFVWVVFTTVIFGAISYPTAIFAGSCSNLTTHGSFDQSGINDNEYGISTVGTFRIEGEPDETKQLLFNLTSIDCEKQRDENGQLDVKCKVTSAVVWSQPVII
jgi:hypothetical protein